MYRFNGKHLYTSNGKKSIDNMIIYIEYVYIVYSVYIYIYIYIIIYVTTGEYTIYNII